MHELGNPCQRPRRWSIFSIEHDRLSNRRKTCTLKPDIDDLSDTLTKAKAAGASVLVEPHSVAGRRATMVQFPGRNIAEIHSDNGK
jgi:predicted enzyme related to lactoylglutathione lyase